MKCVMSPKPSRLTAHLAALAFIAGVEPCPAAEAGGLATYLADRGDAIPTSLFGTYVAEKEFLFYPFYEYTRRTNFEYQPSDFGLALLAFGLLVVWKRPPWQVAILGALAATLVSLLG